MNFYILWFVVEFFKFLSSALEVNETTSLVGGDMTRMI